MNNKIIEWDKSLTTLKNMHRDISNMLVGKTVAYLDYPVHFNVGDLLIYHGTEQFFKDYNVNVVYRSDAFSIKLKKLKDIDVILFHGGGNFGDLYPQIHHVRERIVKLFPNKRIICLPQTIHFSEKSELIQSKKIFNKHDDFHLFVRDDNSMEIASEFTDKHYLCPDMAHSLHPMIDKCEAGITNSFPQRRLNLRRKDIEGKSDSSEDINRGFDWADIIKFDNIIAVRSYRLANKLGLNQSKLTQFWYRESKAIVFDSINHFRSYDLVSTDRLHGMILATLLGQPVVFKDNSYGKNSNYFKKWLADSPFISQ